ncbi:MAG: diguanylate cyclase (GGDEF)-like protein/PAS domain S-box-containing protein [Oleispira sp.]|jgi:diguanylate cyclase (GGDEF)-like protein/PAS domain S-box-containing protein
MKQRTVNEILASSQQPDIDGIIIIDENGLIQAFDLAAQHLLGYSEKEVIDHPITILMSEYQAKKHLRYLKQTHSKHDQNDQGLPIDPIFIGKHKQGQLIPIALTVSIDQSNPIVRFTGVLQDLRKHEQRLSQIFQDFESTTQALNQRIQFDALLNDCSNRLLSCHPKEFVSVMEKTLKSIGKFLSFDHCFILRFSDDFSQGSLWAEWRRSVSLMSPFPKRFDIPRSDIFLKAFSNTHTMVLSDSNNQSPEYKTLFKLAQNMSPNGFISSRITPIQSENHTPVGCIGFSILDPNHKSSDSQIALINNTTQLLINAWGRHRLILKSREAEQDLVNANRILSQQAFHDALTGLPNRRAFDHGLLQEFDRAQRHNGSVCLLMCDIDFFKHYNDHFGHSRGDLCLQQVSRVLQSSFNRAGELCTRYGGEEFAIILPSINHQEATEQADRLLQNLLNAKILHAPSSQQTYLTMSIGIARLSPRQQYSNVQALINAADKALYFAKENGRNQLAWAKEAE